MSKVSVIVAAYNAEKFIGKCLASLESQTHKDIEVVVADDGSTDNTVAVVSRFVDRDCRFRLVRLRENAGQAVARNKALALCSGDIITFLDSDDWFAPNSLELLCATFDSHPQADCVLFDCVMVGEDGSQKSYEGKSFVTMSGHEAILSSLTWSIHGVYAARAWLYKQVPYDDSCRCYSDDNTTHIHYYLSKEVVQSDAQYFYLQHSGSATNKPSVLRMQYLLAADSLRTQLRQLGCSREILSLQETQRWRIVVDGYFFYFKHRSQLTADERSYCLSIIRQSWATADSGMIDKRLRRRLGFVPLLFSWSLFRIEEEIYFRLRRLFGR